MRLVAALFAILCTLATPLRAEPPPAFTAPLQRDHALAGKLWLPAEARFALADEVVARARAADAVLLGETHDNADHHALQAWVLGRLVADGRRPLVAFEMIDAGQEPALRRHLADHPGDAAGLGAALDWDKSAWPAWTLYRPIAETALRAGAPLASANLTRDQVRAIAKGQTDETLPPLTPAQVSRITDEIKAGHCGMLPDSAVAGMVRVQRSRDATMARALADGMRDHGGGVLIAGTGHVRTDHAVPAVLAGLTPAAKVFAVGFVEAQPGETDPATYDAPFDAVWFTPAAEREDQCAAFRLHMDKKQGEKKQGG